MNTAMKRATEAIGDPRLSTGARAFMFWLAVHGDGPVSARRAADDPTWSAARGATTGYVNELVAAGYITRSTHLRNGEFWQQQEVAQKMSHTPEGVAQKSGQASVDEVAHKVSPLTPTSPVATSHKQMMSSGEPLRGSAPAAPVGLADVIDLAARRQPEEAPVPWEIFAEEPEAKPRRSRREPEPETGAVGRLPAEPTTEPQRSSTPGRTHRSDKPRSAWTARDLAAEFTSCVKEKYPMMPMQGGGSRLGPALAKVMSDYEVTSEEVAQMIAVFFDDARRFQRRDQDYRDGLWRVFLAQIPSLLTAARADLKRISGDTAFSPEAAAQTNARAAARAARL